MACFNLIDAYQRVDGTITFSRLDSESVRVLQLPCGRCDGCRLERSRQWAMRCVHEAQLYKRNCFITLTFNDDHLNDTASLDYRDFQLFMKRLRKSNRGFCPGPRGDFPIRFYMCGEYGSKRWRPHYHAVLFNFDFDDKKLWKRTGSGQLIYRSQELERLWPFGYSSIGELTFESAAYVARYVMKKRFGDDAKEHYKRVDRSTGELVHLTPEFNKMSLRPGIGADWFDRYSDDVYRHDHVIINGHECSPPRYYDKLLQRVNPHLFDGVKYDRYLRHQQSIDIRVESSVESAAFVTQTKLNLLKRDLD